MAVQAEAMYSDCNNNGKCKIVLQPLEIAVKHWKLSHFWF